MRAQRAQAKAKRRAQVTESNARRDHRTSAVRALYALAEQVHLPGNRINAKEARNEDVERLVRLLEARMSNTDAMTRLRDAAKLFTDNGGIFSSPVLDVDVVTPAAIDRHRVLLPSFRLKSKAFMLTYNSSTIDATSFDPFRSFIVSLKSQFGARAWAACLEKSLHAEQADRYHMHAYLMWTDGAGIDVRSLDPFYFDGVRPRVDLCTTKMSTTSPHTAACHGLWYVTVMKDGTLRADTNYPAGQWYKAKARWLENLFDDGKIALQSYIRMSAKLFPVGHASRKRDAEEAFRDARDQQVDDHVSAVLASLRESGAYKPLRSFSVVDQFVANFTGLPQWRRPLLLIVGGTNLGKSMLGGAILERVAKELGLAEERFLEITVEDDGHLDMADFNLQLHSGVLLDGVADVLQLKTARETLQGRPKVLKGARSATMKHAYRFTLARRAIVVTMDLSAENLHSLDTDHWLSDPRNVLVLRLTSPCWLTALDHDGEVEAAAEPVSKMDEMRSWSSKGVRCFFQKADLSGAAETLFHQGVNGEDLVAFDHDVLVKELRLTPFTAKKIIDSRDHFLVV